MAMSMASSLVDDKAIWYNDYEAIIPAYMLSRLLYKPFTPGGLIFGLDDYKKDVDICFHHIVYPTEHFDFKPKVYLSELHADQEGNFQHVAYPWQK